MAKIMGNRSKEDSMQSLEGKKKKNERITYFNLIAVCLNVYTDSMTCSFLSFVCLVVMEIAQFIET